MSGIVIDARMKMFAENMGITRSKMVEEYGMKSIDQIIEAEAKQGNTKAITYAQELYNSPTKVMNVFNLYNVENRFDLLYAMDQKERFEVLSMLKPEDLVMGLYFFKQDKLLELMLKVDISELVAVIQNTFPLEQVIAMYTEDDMMQFFQHDELKRYDVMEQLKSLPQDVMIKFIEGITGQEYNQENETNVFKFIDGLPDDKYRDFMSSIDPEVQRQLIYQVTQKNPEYMQLFPNETYVNMLAILNKQDMIPPMENLSKETLLSINFMLPPDLMSVIGAQIDARSLAEYILQGHHRALDTAWML